MSIVVHEMNKGTGSVLHGAPLRLRCENELDFKMVKWIGKIGDHARARRSWRRPDCYNDDHEFYIGTVIDYGWGKGGVEAVPCEQQQHHSQRLARA